MNAYTSRLGINDTEHSLRNHSQTTYQSEFSSTSSSIQIGRMPSRKSRMVSDKLIELQSRLELDKLNDNNSIMEIMRMSEIKGE